MGALGIGGGALLFILAAAQTVFLKVSLDAVRSAQPDLAKAADTAESAARFITTLADTGEVIIHGSVPRTARQLLAGRTAEGEPIATVLAHSTIDLFDAVSKGYLDHLPDVYSVMSIVNSVAKCVANVPLDTAVPAIPPSESPSGDDWVLSLVGAAAGIGATQTDPAPVRRLAITATEWINGWSSISWSGTYVSTYTGYYDDDEPYFDYWNANAFVDTVKDTVRKFVEPLAWVVSCRYSNAKFQACFSTQPMCATGVPQPPVVKPCDQEASSCFYSLYARGHGDSETLAKQCCSGNGIYNPTLAKCQCLEGSTGPQCTPGAPAPSPSASPSAMPSSSPVPSASASASAVPSPSVAPSSSPVPSASAVPSATPSPSAMPSSSPVPSASSVPSASPSSSASPVITGPAFHLDEISDTAFTWSLQPYLIPPEGDPPATSVAGALARIAQVEDAVARGQMAVDDNRVASVFLSKSQLRRSLLRPGPEYYDPVDERNAADAQVRHENNNPFRTGGRALLSSSSSSSSSSIETLGSIPRFGLDLVPGGRAPSSAATEGSEIPEADRIVIAVSMTADYDESRLDEIRAVVATAAKEPIHRDNGPAPTPNPVPGSSSSSDSASGSGSDSSSDSDSGSDSSSGSDSDSGSGDHIHGGSGGTSGGGDENKDKGKFIGIGVGIGAGVALLVAVLAIAMRVKKKQQMTPPGYTSM